MLATGHWGGTVLLWDLERGQELCTLTGHAGPVWAVAWGQVSGYPSVELPAKRVGPLGAVPQTALIPVVTRRFSSSPLNLPRIRLKTAIATENAVLRAFKGPH